MINEFERKSGLFIPKTDKNLDLISKIKDHLTRRQKDFNTEIYVIQKYYVETEKFIIIPRFFPVDEYVSCQIKDNSHEGEDIEISHNITPRNKVQEEAIDFMLKNDKGVIQLNPGMGKTVISIYMIAERKKKTLVLVHRDGLVKQWKNRVLQFTDLNEEDISILKSSSYEEDFKKPIIIATNQTIGSLIKRKPKEFGEAIRNANIGIFIADEVHTTVGAEKFSECSLRVSAKVIWGLSATPYRYDGNTDIINYHLGEVFNIDDSSGTMPAKVTVLLYDFGVLQPQNRGYLYWEGKFQRSRYLSQIKKSKGFLKIIISLIKKFYEDERDMLVVCERVDKLINILYDMINYEDKGKYIAGSSEDTLKAKITLTTPGKCRDGIDVPSKDLCILTSPVRNIAQMAGRIVRINPNKKTPSIIDIVDIGVPEIAKTFYSRNEYYEEKKWEIQYIVINQALNKFVINKSKAMDIIIGR